MEKKKETAPAETGGIFFSSTFDLNHRWVTLTPTTAVQMNGAPIVLQIVQGKLVRMNHFQNVTSCSLENILGKILSRLENINLTMLMYHPNALI